MTHVESFPPTPSPFRRDSRVRVPGRGAFTSVLLAIATIGFIFFTGVAVVLIYHHAATGGAREAVMRISR